MHIVIVLLILAAAIAGSLVLIRRTGNGVALRHLFDHMRVSAHNSLSGSIKAVSRPSQAQTGNALAIGRAEATRKHIERLIADIASLVDRAQELGSDSIESDLLSVKSKLQVWDRRAQKYPFFARLAAWWHNSTVDRLSSQLDQLEKNRNAVRANVQAAGTALEQLDDKLGLFNIARSQASAKIFIPAGVGAEEAEVEAHRQTLHELEEQVDRGDWRLARDELPAWSSRQALLLCRLEEGIAHCQQLRRRYDELKGLTSARLTQGQTLGLTSDNDAKVQVDRVAGMLGNPPVDLDRFEAALADLQTLITAAQKQAKPA